MQNVADPETAMRTLLVKDDVPDVMTLNGNGTSASSRRPGSSTTSPTTPCWTPSTRRYVDIVQALGQSEPGAVNGVPFANNASGVLYNEELFAQQGVEVPTTWDELIAAAKTFQAAGITPFYGMLADAWTAQSPLAPLTAQTAPADFFERAVR